MSAERKPLLPCPFCGNDNFSLYSMDCVRMRQQEIKEAGYGIPLEKPEQRFFVYCGRCGARAGIGQTGPKLTADRAESIAAQKWNQRAGGKENGTMGSI